MKYNTIFVDTYKEYIEKFIENQGDCVLKINKNYEELEIELKLFKEYLISKINDNNSLNYEMYCLIYASNFEPDENILKVVKKLADNGNLRAENVLGCCYYSGTNIENNREEGIKYLKMASQKNFASALNNLGKCYDYLDSEEAKNKAFECYNKSAQLGYANAQYNVANCYMKGEGVDRNFEIAIDYYKKSAKGGNKDAKYKLGLCYENAIGVELDYEKAVYYYKEAIKDKHLLAMCNLGDCYAKGLGVEQNYDKMIFYYKLSASFGCEFGLNALGRCYERGDGVEQDDYVAFTLYKEALKCSDLAYAQFNLGRCYFFGRGTKQDFETAYYYFKLASKQGHADSFNFLGDMCIHGYGVEQNETKAVEYYKLGADSGSLKALINLGVSYELGTGINKDNIKALLCYKTVKDLGEQIGEIHFSLLYNKLLSIYKPLEKNGDENAIKILAEINKLAEKTSKLN